MPRAERAASPDDPSGLQKIVRLDASATGTGGRSLPRELVERTSIRLRFAAAVLTGCASVAAFAEWSLTQGQRPDTWVWTPEQVQDSLRFSVVVIALTLTFMVLFTVKRFEPARERFLGHLFWILAALGMALATTYEVHGHVSWVGVWILAGPLVLPSRPRRTMLVSLTCAAAIPVAYLIHVSRGMLAPSDATALVSFFVPNFVCAGVAYGLAVVIYRLGRSVERQRRLGAYKLVERIGSGAMGEVWRAQHRFLARPAAIKLVKQDRLGGEDTERARARFEREAQATALLRSPHTVELFDFGITEGGDYYYVMELLDGVDLQRLVERYGPLPPARVVHL
ncbi:MAG: protein kinase domain-containing protein, partial [Planctomycetota bacterium]